MGEGSGMGVLALNPRNDERSAPNVLLLCGRRIHPTPHPAAIEGAGSFRHGVDREAGRVGSSRTPSLASVRSPGADDRDRRVEHLTFHGAFAGGGRDRRGQDGAHDIHAGDDMAEGGEALIVAAGAWIGV